MKELILLNSYCRTCLMGVSLLIAFMAVTSCSQITNHLDEPNPNLSAEETGVSGEMTSEEGPDSEEGWTVTLDCSSSNNDFPVPLYVLDGVEINIDPDDEVSKFVDPKDIKSIEVLKGTEALAKYDVGPNRGIVLITTKKNTTVD